MKYHRIAVSQKFREEVLALLPGLANHVGHWRLLGIIVFRSQSGYSRGMQVFLPADLILECYEDRSHRRSAWDYFEQFSEEVFKINVGGWTYGQTRHRDEPRKLESANTPRKLKSLVEAEVKGAEPPTVFLDDGSSVTPRSLKSGVTRLKRIAEAKTKARFGSHNDHAAKLVMRYLNGLPSNRFAHLTARLPEAREVALSLTEPARTQQLACLRQIALKPKPIYSPSERSTRLYSQGPSFLNLQVDVRDTLLRDWVKLDLASCHLAVAASTWGDGMKLTRDFLSKRKTDQVGANLWKLLSDHMGLSLTADVKSVLKEALYSLIYGMGEEGLREHFEDTLPIVSDGLNRFLSQPIIAECWAQRRKELRLIEAAGFGIDCFGDKIRPPTYLSGDYNWRSVLAVRAQSYELALLQPAYELAMALPRGHGFKIMMHLHDGIAIVADRKAETNKWVNEIKIVVDRKAEELGISTWLEHQA